jgi:uncharacterized membrane protein YkvA (DUF1232 family)
MTKQKKSERESEFNMNKIAEFFSQSTNKAKEIVDDKEKTKKVLQEAMDLAEKIKGPLEKVWDILKLMFWIVSDWILGKYKAVPIGSIIAIIAALIYLISPIDAIPDPIPVIGYIDDVFVIGLVFAQVRADLEKYEIWKEANS